MSSRASLQSYTIYPLPFVAVNEAHGKLILFFPSSVISHLRNLFCAHLYFLPLSSSTARIHLLLCPSLFSLYIYLIFSLSFIPLYFFHSYSLISAISFCNFLPHLPLTAITFIWPSLAGTRTKYIPNANQVCYHRLSTKHDTQ